MGPEGDTMSTAILANPVEMIRRGAPRVIHSDEELDACTAALFRLTAEPVTTPDEDEAIALLTLLIDRYETERFPVQPSEPAEVLRLLMESHRLRQKDLVAEFGAESTVSAVLSRRRQMTRDQIARLSRRFSVSPAVFFPEAPPNPRETTHTSSRALNAGSRVPDA